MRKKWKMVCGIWVVIIIVTGCSSAKVIKESNKNTEPVETVKKETEYKYYFVEGIKQKMLGNLGQAVSYFESALKLNPKSSAACYELSSIYTIARDFTRATEYARKAEKMDDANLWFKLHLANLFHLKQNLDSTIVIYEEIHRKFPDRNDLAFNLSELYKERGDKEKALEIYEELENRVGISKHLGLAKEELYERKGEFGMAKNELDKLLEVYENDVNILGVLAELYHNYGYDEKAKETYNVMVRIDPENINTKVSLLGYYRKRKEYSKVFDIVKELIENVEVKVNDKVQLMLSFISNPDEINDFGTNIEILVRKLEEDYPNEFTVKAIAADLCIRNGKLEEAREKLKFLIENKRANYILWEQFLLIENSMSNYAELYRKSDEAIKIFPEKPTLYLLKGISANELNKHEIAVKTLEEGLKFIKNNNQLIIQFYSLIGDSYRSSGLHKKSDEAMKRALEIDPENTIILNNYAYYLSERSEQLRKALKMSDMCLRVEPLNATYLDTYGWILFKMGKIREAEKYLKKAMNNAGVNDPEITEHYGDVLYKLNEKSRAIDLWNDAIILGGEKVRIEKKIKQVKEKGKDEK